MPEGSRKDRRRAHRLTRKIIMFLHENEDGWRIKLERIKGNKELCRKLGFTSMNIVGCVLWDENLIIVDMRDDALSTLIHEILHVLYDEDSEADILLMEEMVMMHITSRQAEKVWFYAALLMNVTFTE